MGSVPHSGPSKQFLVSDSAQQLVKQRLWYVLSCMWNDTYKRSLAANQKE